MGHRKRSTPPTVIQGLAVVRQPRPRRRWQDEDTVTATPLPVFLPEPCEICQDRGRVAVDRPGETWRSCPVCGDDSDDDER